MADGRGGASGSSDMKVSAGLIVIEHRDPVSHHFIAENQGECRHCWNVIQKEKDHFLFLYAGEEVSQPPRTDDCRTQAQPPTVQKLYTPGKFWLTEAGLSIRMSTPVD